MTQTKLMALSSSSFSTSSPRTSSISTTTTNASTTFPPPALQLLTPNFIQHSANPNTDTKETERRSRAPIFSLDIHPDNLRLVTGGNDHFVRLWNLNAVLTPGITKNDSIVKELFAGKRHDGAVMCVRWASKTGSLLASGADDGSLVIWTLEKKPSMFNSLFSGGNGEKYQETLHFVKKLPSMESDVIDLAWSHDNKFLASCSLDNSIVIWDGRSFERVARCMHQSFVKGLAFDPIGQYLASQSDDGSTVLWDTSTWRQYKKIAHPFVKGAVAGIVRRPCWSPDADYLACVNAISQGIHVAAVIPRNKWWEPKKCIHLVGHRAPVCVAKFNPILIQDPSNPDQVTSILALGSNDRRISVWILKHRPVLILERLFHSDIMDLVWSSDGQVLLASAREGRVAGLHFPNLAFFQCKLLDTYALQKQLLDRHQFDLNQVQFVNHSDILNTSEPMKPVPLTPQRVTHTKDGRKRIQPTLIASLSISSLQSSNLSNSSLNTTTVPLAHPHSTSIPFTHPSSMSTSPPFSRNHIHSSSFDRCFSPSLSSSLPTTHVPTLFSLHAPTSSTSSPPSSFMGFKPFTIGLPCPSVLTPKNTFFSFSEVGHIYLHWNETEVEFLISLSSSPLSLPSSSSSSSSSPLPSTSSATLTSFSISIHLTQGPILQNLALSHQFFVYSTLSYPPKLYVYAIPPSSLSNSPSCVLDGMCLDALSYSSTLKDMVLSVLTCRGTIYVYDLAQLYLMFKTDISHLLPSSFSPSSPTSSSSSSSSSSSTNKMNSNPFLNILLDLVPFQSSLPSIIHTTVQVSIEGAKYLYHPGLQSFFAR